MKPQDKLVTKHMSVLLPWHDSGWNGHFCKDPEKNIYCRGQTTYPPGLGENFDLEQEKKNKEKKCTSDTCPACSLSVNSFGKEKYTTTVLPPEFWKQGNNPGADPAEIDIEPYTSCGWCYEEMYNNKIPQLDGDYQGDNNKKWKEINDQRKKNADRFFGTKEETGIFVNGKSLIFYYLGYKNPFNEETDGHKRILVGISRLKKIGPEVKFENVHPKVKESNNTCIAWHRTITNSYPKEGFCIPLYKYMDRPDILQKLVIKTTRPPFKYLCRSASNDDAIIAVSQLLKVVDELREMGDDTQVWVEKKTWLLKCHDELWQYRGAYPGFVNVMSVLNMNTCKDKYLEITMDDPKKGNKDRKKYADIILMTLSDSKKEITKKEFGDRYKDKEINEINKEINDARKELLKLQKTEEGKYAVKLLTERLCRFDLTEKQICYILPEVAKLFPESEVAKLFRELKNKKDNPLKGGNRDVVSITSSLKDIYENPYILFEQYCGIDNDDKISLYTIDFGVIPSSHAGFEEAEKDLFKPNSPERLRALLFDAFSNISRDTFYKADTLLTYVNSNQINSMYGEKVRKLYYDFCVGDLVKDYKNRKRQIIAKRFVYEPQTPTDTSELYMYLKEDKEDEKEIKDIIKKLEKRKSFRSSAQLVSLKNCLKQDIKELKGKKKLQTKYNEILENQASAVQQILKNPLAILSGSAGTGKTSCIKAVLKNLPKNEEDKVLLLAPTGKAADRIRSTTECKSAETIHSFLNKNGMIRSNNTIKRNASTKSSEYSTIIIDECSMIALDVFAAFVKCIDWNHVKRLILVGDPNQLPPIGKGKVFNDIIQHVHDSGMIVKLEKNMRLFIEQNTGHGAGILELAEYFIQEKFPKDESKELAKLITKIQNKKKNENTYNDIDIVIWNDVDELQEKLTSEYMKDLQKLSEAIGKKWDNKDQNLWRKIAEFDKDNKRYTRNIEKMQILSPYRSNEFGVDYLNSLIQERFNNLSSNKYKMHEFGTYDKIIQIKNTKHLNKPQLSNGDVGLIAYIGPINPRSRKSQKVTKINFARKDEKDDKKNILYNYNESVIDDNIELAYAISIHKAQGSDFEKTYVIIPKSESAGSLLSMELIYTAITRAKKHTTLFIQDDPETLLSFFDSRKISLKGINSSIFDFNPIDEDALYDRTLFNRLNRYPTKKKEWVRSLAEQFIADYLYEKGIKYTYEKKVLVRKNTKEERYLTPDFTIEYHGKDYILEHLGLVGDPIYDKHWRLKEEAYKKDNLSYFTTEIEFEERTTPIHELIDKQKESLQKQLSVIIKNIGNK